MMSTSLKFVAAGQGPKFNVIGGDQITIKATGADTGGQLAVVETSVPPHAGPPPHVHHRESETFYVLEGNFQFQIGRETIDAAPGDFLHAPVDVPHRFRNVTDAPGKLLIVCQPAGFEKFIEAFAALPPDSAPDPAKMADIAADYGIEFVSPSAFQ